MCKIYVIYLFINIFKAQAAPGGRRHIFAAVFLPVDSGFGAQDIRTFLTDIIYGHKGTDIQAHAIVKVGLPSNGLFVERFTAHECIVGRFTFQGHKKTAKVAHC